MGRKPLITKEDAALIAIRFASSHGVCVSGAVEASASQNGSTWTVFLPDGGRFDPGGVIVVVHQQTGEATFLPTL